jgi:hypothetical protein
MTKPTLRAALSVTVAWTLLLVAAHPSEPRGEEVASARGRLLDRMGVSAWHADGWRGQGVKVAVLDSGFRGYRDHLGKALPDQVKVKSFRADGDLEAKDSRHGILCGEVVHAVAPEAELLFANWDADSPKAFLDAVRWAKREGAKVMTCSLIEPTWSDGEGGGDVHQALSDILGDDVLFFACAGNTALRHWSGAFHDGGDGWHRWAEGATGDGVWGNGTEPPSVEMCWSGSARYELVVWDTTADREVGRGAAIIGDGRRSAAVRFEPQSRHEYSARVRLLSGKPGTFHLVVLNGGLERATPRGSIPFPGDGAEVVAVAAVDEEGRREPYSSCGPNGTKAKPDLAAVVPFPSVWRERPFSGTSAAAPQAAGLAALIGSRRSELTASKLRDLLDKSGRREIVHLP